MGILGVGPKTLLCDVFFGVEDQGCMVINMTMMNLKSKNQVAVGGLFTQQGDVQVTTQQMSMKKGLKMFGKDGEVAVKSKMQQLHDRNVMLPIKHKELTYNQKKEALGYLMILKCKRHRKIKIRCCDYSCKQQVYILKEETTLSTISTKEAFLTLLLMHGKIGILW